jgi:hypothetical protein
MASSFAGSMQPIGMRCISSTAHSRDTVEDWVIEIGDETGAIPLVVLPSSVPKLRPRAA